MAKHISSQQLNIIMICTFLLVKTAYSLETIDDDDDQNNAKLNKRSVLFDGDDDDVHHKRYASYRSDLGKRDLGKRMSAYRSDLGKRSDYTDTHNAFQNIDNGDDNDIYKRIVLGDFDDSDLDKRAAFRADLGKRFSAYRTDLGKRGVGILSQQDAPQDLLETIKRYGGMGFRADLGKRSGELSPEDEEILSEILSAQKRAYRSDLGKRYSSFRTDLGKRSKAFRSDLGKRSSPSFRSDLGKRQYFRADLGKRAYYRSDLGKRSAFRADLGKRQAYRADLGKRSTGIVQ